MRDNQTLHSLHLAIQDAFEFDNDHLYSFFMSGKAWDQSTEYKLAEGQDPWPQTPKEDLPGDSKPPPTRAMTGEMKLRQIFGSNFDGLQGLTGNDKWDNFLDQFAGPGDALATKLEHLKLELEQNSLLKKSVCPQCG